MLLVCYCRASDTYYPCLFLKGKGWFELGLSKNCIQVVLVTKLSVSNKKRWPKVYVNQLKNTLKYFPCYYYDYEQQMLVL